jgi:hypothetical protein
MPPQNAGYMHAAYCATGVIYAAYAVSIWWRARSVERRQQREIDARAAHVDS